MIEIQTAILVFIFGGIMVLFLMAAIWIAAQHVLEELAKMLVDSTETLKRNQERHFQNAEGDRRNIEARLYFGKQRQYKMLKLLKTLHKK